MSSQPSAASHATEAPGWTAVPVDDVGYIEAAELMKKTDDELMALIAGMRSARYGGWRNDGGKWRDIMGLDIGGRTVLDFGCGIGLEALELARAGNKVMLYDIHPVNIRLAGRVLRIHGYKPENLLVRTLTGTIRFGTFHCAGVLHHVREPEQVIEWAHDHLTEGGEARLMVYSDEGWRLATGTEPPQDVTQHTDFMKFVRFFDAVGDYADWYDANKLQERFGRWFSLERVEYMTPDRRYLGAVLRRRDD